MRLPFGGSKTVKYQQVPVVQPLQLTFALRRSLFFSRSHTAFLSYCGFWLKACFPFGGRKVALEI